MYTNEDRINSVAPFISAFSVKVGNQHEDPATQVGDMICNMLHWVNQNSSPTDALDALRAGLGHFLAELQSEVDDDELGLGPDVFITIQANWRDIAGNKHLADSITGVGSTIL